MTMKSLSDLNDEKAVTLIPAMAFFGLLMVVGMVGNSLVVYIFCAKLRSGTQNMLIVALAIFDLMTCAITIPSDIVDLRFFFTYQSQAACKTMRYVC
ncbi:unnamed protein product [Lymnaea stagnalis]|uniref:G-protein coupled receptors family 1 profile domain-containing protein n=1 Tax=Lymnaea stagnalis TaxID=6523 RepID=A0AAV2IDF4_LYMST